jgi:hypothetical protein
MTSPKNKYSLEQEKRERYLRNLIQEAVVNTLVEQEADRSAAPPSPVAPAPETNQPSAEPPVPPEETQGQQQEEFTADTLVDKLNVLRGGKSFTDPEVFGKLTTFFNNLTDEQKVSLDYFLSEMGKIVIGVVEQEAGLEHQQQHTQPSGQAQRPPAGSQPPKAAPAPSTTAPVTPSMGV